MQYPNQPNAPYAGIDEPDQTDPNTLEDMDRRRRLALALQQSIGGQQSDPYMSSINFSSGSAPPLPVADLSRQQTRITQPEFAVVQSPWAMLADTMAPKKNANGQYEQSPLMKGLFQSASGQQFLSGWGNNPSSPE